jgi:trehalose 6-phosphate phosphatase
MADPEYIISREHIDAVLFDLDGVLTRTAKIHAAAWKTLFDDYLSKQMLSDPSPFDPDRDYHRYVDGKPRQMGVKHFLQPAESICPWVTRTTRRSAKQSMASEIAKI